MRTTPMPPRPGGVAIATIVSDGEKGMATARSGGRRGGRLSASHQSSTRRYLRNEMRTVFENASPTLSVVAPGTSATAMCTIRRS